MLNNARRKVRNFIHRSERFSTTYRLTSYTGVALLLLGVLTGLTLYAYFEDSVARAQTVRTELTDRDLRDLVSRFDTDERFVLQHNVAKLTKNSRFVTPLLLPRSYYIPLPASRAPIFPRQPPRNCYVTLLEPDRANASSSDRLCAYYLDSEASGRHLFIGMDVSDNSIVPLKYGDPKLLGDSIRLSIKGRTQQRVWWVTYQHAGTGNERYEITAFRELLSGAKERDRKLEGWGYSQKQVDGSQILRLLIRIDLKDFMSDLDATEQIAELNEIQISTMRRDFDQGSKIPKVLNYGDSGISNLSIPSLSKAMFSAHASLHVKAIPGGTSAVAGGWEIENPQVEKETVSDSWIAIKDGNFIVRRDPIVRSRYLQDTNLLFEVSHPRFVIEQGTWRVLILLSVLALGGVVALYLSYTLLLQPIYALTREARKLTISGTEKDRLPFKIYKNEIGILAGTFNDLISKIREHIEREDYERRRREAMDVARFQAAQRNWLENLGILGHEIRSPLQDLLSLHGSESESRKFLDRITAALPHLQLGLTPEQAASSRVLEIESIDMHEFLAEVAKNVCIDIENVVYESAQTNLICAIDPDTFANVLDNILRNADRHRFVGTPIRIELFSNDHGATIKVINNGHPIDPNIKQDMFKFGVSTAPKEKGYGRGIGLWQAQLYIDRMRGSISAENLSAGDGVCVEIWIPLEGSISALERS